MTTTDFTRTRVAGRGIPLPGNDIDTDRIIPARFLKAVTFEGMGEHAFEDARKQNPEHPFNSPAYKGASVLVVGQNFGCGSSREHAPQALMRWGIRAIVGGSFGEIFFGNCVIIGVPCLTVSQADLVLFVLDARAGVTPADGLTFGLAALLCAVMTLAGSLTPALRAVRMPPALVFRGD